MESEKNNPARVIEPDLLDIIKKFNDQKIGVIGDLMLDRYLFCEVNRISPEAPVPVARVYDEKFVLGGAGNVAANVASMGGVVLVLGIIGQDQRGESIKNIFKNSGINFEFSYNSSDRPTTVKTRLISGSQQIVRIDREMSEEISFNEEKIFLDTLPKFLDNLDLVIISDYAKGFVTENLAKKIIESCNDRGIKVFADPVPETFYKFKNCFLVKPNKKEAETISQVKLKKDYSNIQDLMKALHLKFNSNLVVTLGSDGMAVWENDDVYRIQTSAREVFDVSGAGDSVMAALGLAIAAGANLNEAALIGSYAAGIVVGKMGTATVSQGELSNIIENERKNTKEAIIKEHS